MAWRFYGVVRLVRRSRGYHGGFTAFSVRYGGVIICMAFLLSFKSLRSRDKHSGFTSQGGRFAPGRLDPPNRPQGCRFAGVIILSMIF